jgi:hypothetical protein
MSSSFKTEPEKESGMDEVLFPYEEEWSLNGYIRNLRRK